MADDSRLGRGVLLGALAVFAVPPVALAWLDGTGVPVPGYALTLALLVPLAALALGLGALAREVGSSADDPDLVEERMTEGTGMTAKEFEELFD